MNKLTSYIVSVGIISSYVGAEVDWTPRFNDEPVPPERIKAIEKAVPAKPIVNPVKKRKVLVYSATAGYRHKSIPTGKVALEKMGESTGAYEAVISDELSNFKPETLKGFDAVVLLSPTLKFFMPREVAKKKFTDDEWEELSAQHERLTENLVSYVKAGGGLMGIHSATDACYECKEYGDMIGAYFDGHPWRANMTVSIDITDKEHETIKPVFGDLDSFLIKDEIYQFSSEPYSREKLRILLNLNVENSDEAKGLKRDDGDYAVAWVQSVGEGRVFYSSLGHNHEIFSNPLILNHYLAGIQFATGDLEADTTPSVKIDIPNVQ